MQERDIIEYSLRLNKRDTYWDIQRIRLNMT